MDVTRAFESRFQQTVAQMNRKVDAIDRRQQEIVCDFFLLVSLQSSEVDIWHTVPPGVLTSSLTNDSPDEMQGLRDDQPAITERNAQKSGGTFRGFLPLMMSPQLSRGVEIKTCNIFCVLASNSTNDSSNGRQGSRDHRPARKKDEKTHTSNQEIHRGFPYQCPSNHDSRKRFRLVNVEINQRQSVDIENMSFYEGKPSPDTSTVCHRKNSAVHTAKE